MNKMIFLGTGAAVSLTRQMTSILFVTDGGNFLIDCGDGMGTARQIVKAGVGLTSVRDIFLTHRHTDHIIGLPHILFLELLKDQKAKIRVFGSKQTVRIVKKICFDTQDYVKKHKNRVAFIPIKENEEVRIGKGVTVTPIRVDGPKEIRILTFGYRISIGKKSVVFSADTLPSRNLVRKSMHTDILVHECFSLHKERINHPGLGHSTAREAGETAQKAQATQLILTHLQDDSWVDSSLLLAEARKYFRGKVTVAEDLMEVEI